MPIYLGFHGLYFQGSFREKESRGFGHLCFCCYLDRHSSATYQHFHLGHYGSFGFYGLYFQAGVHVNLGVLGYRFWVSGSGLSATGSHFELFFVLGFCGLYGSEYRYPWLHSGESPPFPFRRDQGKLRKLIFGCRSCYTSHLIGCNSMPPCFHFLFQGSTENYN